MIFVRLHKNIICILLQLCKDCVFWRKGVIVDLLFYNSIAWLSNVVVKIAKNGLTEPFVEVFELACDAMCRAFESHQAYQVLNPDKSHCYAVCRGFKFQRFWILKRINWYKKGRKWVILVVKMVVKIKNTASTHLFGDKLVKLLDVAPFVFLVQMRINF